MVKHRRDRHDIAAQILRKARVGKNKTELMRQVNISFTQAQQYFSMLLQKGLLEIDQNHHLKTTRKGLEFLEKCEECFLFEWNKHSR
jgi:predicted transcriptional regulator